MGVNYLDVITSAGSQKGGAYSNLTSEQKAKVSAGIAADFKTRDQNPTLAVYSGELKRDGIAAKISQLSPDERAKLHYLTNREDFTGGDMYGDIKADIDQYRDKKGGFDTKKIDEAFKKAVQSEKDNNAELLKKGVGANVSKEGPAAFTASLTPQAQRSTELATGRV